MSNVRFILAVIALLSFASLSSATMPLLGGASPAEVTDDVNHAAEFAVNTLSSENAYGGKLDLVKVLSVKKQVVAGTNYFITLAAKGSDGSDKHLDVTVFQGLPDRNSNAVHYELKKHTQAQDSETHDAQAAAESAVESINSRSNSLYKYSLKRTNTSMAPSAQPLPVSVSDEKYANVKWEELAFKFVRTDYMYVAKCNHGESFQEGKILPFADLQLNPCAAVLQYGQGLYEGLKAYRTEDGRILLFRPDQNGLRLQAGADRLYMPYPSVDQFVSAIKQVALANKKWIPPPGKGTLYIRPILFGSGPILGSFPIPETTFTAFACPVGRYHKDNSGLNLKIEDQFRRAFPSGTGGVKSITNYCPVWIPLAEAKKQGFSDILFLDAATGKNIEELFAANVFMLKGNVVSTPTIAGTILPGVTRNCVMELCRDFGYQVEERTIPLVDFLDADEAFCTGTASIVTSIASVTFKDKKTGFKTGEETLAAKLYETLSDIQTGRVEDTKGWTVEIDRQG